MELVPNHLKKYIVSQDYNRYTAVDHAVWRFILRQLKSFLSRHAHESYLDGLEKTGISIDRIPSIEEISEKLKHFGWRALPVSGFIPPAAFMELQSLGVLPIASDMRTLDHLEYTPAPDIVHEAAGHAPILVNKDFSNYLQQYAQVARKAIISKEDLNVYEAIRNLSDLKEHPDSTPDQIAEAQAHLEKVSASVTHISEAAQLGRMNWWTAEYGLIGDLKNPRIFGAGLLSSIGESKWCLSDKVKKIPLTVDCIQQGYDITEPQPQLFVTPDFSTLTQVLNDMADRMAFRVGGALGVKKAIQSETANTLELSSGIQASGQVVEALGGDVEFFRMSGPCQLCFKDKELPEQGRRAHAQGFSTPVGRWSAFPGLCPSNLSDEQLKSIGLVAGQSAQLEFVSGVRVQGLVKSLLRKEGKLVLITWENCTVHGFGKNLFQPDWGSFDMLVGEKVSSVFGGPADRPSFGETDDFVARKVPQKTLSEADRQKIMAYQMIRDLRDGKLQMDDSQVQALLSLHQRTFPNDWLLSMEVFEISKARSSFSKAQTQAFTHLERVMASSEKLRSIIQEGIQIAAQ